MHILHNTKDPEANTRRNEGNYTHMIDVFSGLCTHFHKKHGVEVSKLHSEKGIKLKNTHVQKYAKKIEHTSLWLQVYAE